MHRDGFQKNSKRQYKSTLPSRKLDYFGFFWERDFSYPPSLHIKNGRNSFLNFRGGWDVGDPSGSKPSNSKDPH